MQCEEPQQKPIEWMDYKSAEIPADVLQGKYMFLGLRMGFCVARKESCARVWCSAVRMCTCLCGMHVSLLKCCGCLSFTCLRVWCSAVRMCTCLCGLNVRPAQVLWMLVVHVLAHVVFSCAHVHVSVWNKCKACSSAVDACRSLACACGVQLCACARVCVE